MESKCYIKVKNQQGEALPGIEVWGDYSHHSGGSTPHVTTNKFGDAVLKFEGGVWKVWVGGPLCSVNHEFSFSPQNGRSYILTI